ncbi:hypothetical protein MELE44368_16860 [Mycolicibacterium elephantis DSM 44368]|uniref:Uncharacterized protein n=1 Tax=Mycolicibacterium elephantis DSM 44368 TaxID=1335622 RepID=A0A439DW74_9MYCO|nr:hypothetical protein MELE44368_16860 [Mycolicibacterium elephantis DSM 44368]
MTIIGCSAKQPTANHRHAVPTPRSSAMRRTITAAPAMNNALCSTPARPCVFSSGHHWLNGRIGICTMLGSGFQTNPMADRCG